jgi:hypothetical protein
MSETTTASATPRALLVCERDLAPGDQNVGKLLDFFGVPWQTLTTQELTETGLPDTGLPASRTDGGRWCLLASATAMAQAVRVLNESGDGWARIAQRVDSIYVYGFQPTETCNDLLKTLTRNGHAKVQRPGSNMYGLNGSGSNSGPHVNISVTRDFSEMCGPMSGVEVAWTPTESDVLLDLGGAGESLQCILATKEGEGEVFAKLTWKGVPFYLSASADTIDIEDTTRKPFDIRQNFCSAVPIVIYIKWAFHDICWQGSSETRACLIVDDPPLKPRYGFLRFKRALELMDEHHFTMSLAFIPWNRQRTDSAVVRLFQERSDKFSISIHGCDHTASEFGTRSSAELNARTKIANERMKSLSRRTSLKHDQVMVFPQGEFSTETGRVLKLNGFLAAVNTEVTPSHESGDEPRIADLWEIALDRYGTFPIFTRRYFTHGLENFAFDILLGKPCLLVAHHKEFKDDARELVEFIDRLNALSCKLVWGNLGEVASHSFRMRRQADGCSVVQMYGSGLMIENSSEQAAHIEIVKKEGDGDCLQAVTVNGKDVEWRCEGAYLRFRAALQPGEKAEVRVRYVDKFGEGVYPSDVGYRVKTGLRRYLSETRDQYLSQNEILSRSAGWVRQVLK